MKKSLLLLLAGFAIVVVAGCDKSNTDVAKKLAELERQHREALEQKQLLERQLADQLLASERDAIERERMRIEDERAALEQEKGAEAAAKQQALAVREQELANREGKLEGRATALEDQQQDLQQREQLLSGRELELAGREAIPEADTPPADTLPVTDYGTFYDGLASYGSWFESPDYGYVWQPAVVRTVGWRPYVDGTWVCTDHGWTWISNEPFGWACYHYGRWALLRGRGWIWVPGDQWAPAWVCWRESGSHIGWAPLPPETLGWRDCTWDASVETRFGISAGWFNFVAINHFSSPIRRHCLPVAQNPEFWQHTTNITNIRCRERNVFVGGPRYQDICRSLGRPAPYYQLNLNHHQRPDRDPLAMRPQRSGNQLTIAAPAIHANWNAALRPTRVRGQLQDVAIERAKPLDQEVVSHFRQKREQDRLQADQAMTELGGRDAFRQRRTQVLEANQQKDQQAEAQRGRTAGDARQRRDEAANQQKDQQAEAQRGRTADETRQRRDDTAKQQKDQQAEAQRQRALDETRQRRDDTAKQQKDQQAEAQRQRALDETRQRQAEAAKQQKDQQAEAQRQRALEDARQRQADTAKQQKDQQAEAQRQRALEDARQRQQEQLQRQAEEANQQRQRAAEDARQRQQEQARQRQAEEANQQRAQQAEQQRQRGAEEARQRQQEETKKRDEDSRERRSGR
jgi:hypothetical protein